VAASVRVRMMARRPQRAEPRTGRRRARTRAALHRMADPVDRLLGAISSLHSTASRPRHPGHSTSAPSGSSLSRGPGSPRQAGEPVAQRCRHWLPDPRVEARGVCEQHDGRCVARRPPESWTASSTPPVDGHAACRSVVVHGLTLSDDCWGATTKTFSWSVTVRQQRALTVANTPGTVTCGGEPLERIAKVTRTLTAASSFGGSGRPCASCGERGSGH